jgi:O-antigen biosynthesis protein WbqL
MSLPATPGPDEARESVVQQIAGALAAEQDSVVELGRDGAFAERYETLEQLDFYPPEAREQVTILRRFGEHRVLADRIGVFDRVAIINDSVLLRDGAAIQSPNFIPGYLSSIYTTHPGYKAAIAGHDKAESVELDEPVFAPLHPWCKIYGHFLVEALPRLAVIRELYRLGFSFPVYINADAPKFIEDYLALALPEARLLRGKRGVVYRAGKVLIPNIDMPLMRLTERRVRFLDDLVGGCYGAEQPRRAPWRKLFLLRPGQAARGYRYLANQDTLSGIAAGFGYQSVAPEKLSIAEQVRLFGEARCIAGEYSSALHNALLAPEGTAVVAFNWVNHYQLCIAQAKGHGLAVIAPEAGRFIGANTSPAEIFTISADSFRAALLRCEPVAEVVEMKLAESALARSVARLRKWFGWGATT